MNLYANKIYIKKSNIPKAGRGVFAIKTINKGELIEECPVIEIPLDDASNLKESALVNYFFYWGSNNERLAIALGSGSIYNHSYEPNATYKKYSRSKTIQFIAIRNIQKDEEITTNYNFGNPKDKTKPNVAGIEAAK